MKTKKNKIKNSHPESKTNNKKSDYLQAVIAIIVCQFAGFVGMLFTTPNIPTWYATLNKPFFSPPNFVFGPVWITLYTLMGISVFLIWKKGIEKKENKTAIIFFGVQLILNALWSLSFFGLQNPLYGLINIVVLLAVLAVTIYKFYKIDKRAAYLLIPYFLWGAFATLLNLAIFLLN